MKRYITPVVLLLAVFLTIGLFIVEEGGRTDQSLQIQEIDENEACFLKMNENWDKELTGSSVQDIGCLDREDKEHKLSKYTDANGNSMSSCYYSGKIKNVKCRNLNIPGLYCLAYNDIPTYSINMSYRQFLLAEQRDYLFYRYNDNHKKIIT